MVGYRFSDVNNNRFIANYSIDDYIILQVGSTRRQPCVTLEVIREENGENNVVIQDFLYDIRCSENDLAQGRTGTRSMLKSALNLIKEIHPEVKTFSLQDEATVKDTNIPLSAMYLLTRGKSYYHDVFPDLKMEIQEEQKRYENMMYKMNKQVDRSFDDIMSTCFKKKQGSLDDPQYKDWKKIHERCFRKEPWYIFFKQISELHDIRFWKDNLQKIQVYMQVILLRGHVWIGDFENLTYMISRINILENDVEFNQIGGENMLKNQRFDWGDM